MGLGIPRLSSLMQILLPCINAASQPLLWLENLLLNLPSLPAFAPSFQAQLMWTQPRLWLKRLLLIKTHWHTAIELNQHNLSALSVA